MSLSIRAIVFVNLENLSAQTNHTKHPYCHTVSTITAISAMNVGLHLKHAHRISHAENQKLNPQHLST